MFFNSLNYIFFLSISVFLIYFFPNRFKWLVILLFSSFYYYSLPSSNIILFVSLIIFNYLSCFIVKKQIGVKTKLFLTSVIVMLNIAVLFLFKFFASPIIPYPLGLSYLVLPLIAYDIEVYRNNSAVNTNFGIFLTAGLFFPKVAQGPIEKPAGLFSQLKLPDKINSENIYIGIKFIIWGLFKKLVIADRLAIYTNVVFSDVHQYNGKTYLLALFLYTIQIYTDFSGYTDIALGSAKMFGINLIQNFNRPYFLFSLREFWNRWHISLSLFLRDYVFLPVSYKLTKIFKGKKLKLVYFISTFITFSLCGLWHGIEINYLVWGIFWSIVISLSLFTKKIRGKLSYRTGLSKHKTLRRSFQIAFSFIVINFSWLLFRLSLNDAFTVAVNIFTKPGSLFIEGGKKGFFYAGFGIIILLLFEFLQETRLKKSEIPEYDNSFKEILSYVFLVIIILVIGVLDGSQFIYFKF